MSIHHYILNEQGDPFIEPDLITWAKWFEKAKRHAGLTTVGRYKISTVFLGLDHNWGLGPPVVWETMVFKKESKGKKWILGDFMKVEMDRCSGSSEQAEAMHEKMVKLVKKKYKAKS